MAIKRMMLGMSCGHKNILENRIYNKNGTRNIKSEIARDRRGE